MALSHCNGVPQRGFPDIIGEGGGKGMGLTIENRVVTTRNTKRTTAKSSCRVYSPPGVAFVTHRRPVRLAAGSNLRRSVSACTRVG